MSKYKKWKPEEISFVANNYENVKDEQLAQKLSEISGETITVSMIRRQRRKLKLNKKRGRPITRKTSGPILEV